MLNLLKTAPFDFGTIFSNIGKNWYYYLALAVVVALLILFALLKKKNRNEFSPTQKVVYIALLSALCFLGNYFTIKAGDYLQISFVALAGFVSGYMFGPIGGFAAAFIGDLIGGIVAPFGAYNPIIGIGTGMWGFVPGLIFERFNGNDYVKTVISFLIGFILNSFLINTIGLTLMYGMNFEDLLFALPFKLATCGINMGISILLVPLFPRILPKDKFPFIREREATANQ